jgi:RNA polymerase sigma-70 factor (ECF subfamily)
MSINDSEFHKIYDIYQPKILRYLTHFISEGEAEDLTQETFVKVYQSLENFRGESQLSAWIYRIATNIALDRLRSPSFQRMAKFELSDDSVEGDDRVVLVKEESTLVEKQLIRNEMNDCVRGHIEKLPETYRAVLVLSEYEGLKNHEIAEVMGVTLDVVKIRLHRARAKLKEDLETNCEIHWIEEIPCSVKKSITEFG